MKKSLFIIAFLLIGSVLFAQVRDRAVFTEDGNKFWEKIEQSIKKFEAKPSAPAKSFKLDVSGRSIPDTLGESIVWHNPPISQGNSGTCWSYSNTSFFESEIYRMTGKKVKLSEMHTVYWEVVEKARRYVRERGNSHFDEGSEANAVTRIWNQYGVVPAEAYIAMKPGQEFHNHEPMFAEMKSYLSSLKTSNAWNEQQVLETIQAILDHYMGKPPKTVVVDGKTLTPLQYLETLQIKVDDYVDLLSFMEFPYYEMAEYRVPDNWWHSQEYLNVPLDEFMAIVKEAVRKGYSIAFAADVTEPGYLRANQVAIVPSFDIPAEHIDENARQFRFDNKTSTDDHGIHCVGVVNKDGKDWYVVKDSGSGCRNGKNPGYFFYHEDYVKLKILSVMVHKDVAGEALKKYQEKKGK